MGFYPGQVFEPETAATQFDPLPPFLPNCIKQSERNGKIIAKVKEKHKSRRSVNKRHSVNKREREKGSR